MKKNFVKICAVLLGFTMVACLEDDKYALSPEGSYNVIEFMDPSVPNSPSGAVYPLWTTVTEVSPEFIFQQTISYSGANNNDQDIEVLVEVDPSALEEYNQQMTDVLHGDTYLMMPPNYYDFPPTTVIIPKGQKRVTFDIRVIPDQFDLAKSFALPLRITSASEGVLSQHFSAAMFAVVVKNVYDGIYDVTDGEMIRLVAGVPDGALGGDFVAGIEIPFVTINGTNTSFAPTWKDGSGVGGIAGTKVEVLPGAYTPPGAFTAPATAQPIVISSSGNASLTNDVARLNYYDPATKTFVMNFYWNPGANSRTVKDYMLVWDRSR